MTALLLSLVLSAAPQTFYVDLEPSSVNLSWQPAIVAGAVEEVRASHGRQAFPKGDERSKTARFLLALRVASSHTTALVVVKIFELADGKLVRTSQVALENVTTKEKCVAEVRALVKKELEALPVDLPEPKKKKE
ncbi:MAG: hypothetical protein QM765_53375 [Myxococcales bacterium]